MSEELFLTFERRVFQVELFIQTKTLCDLNIPFTSNGFVEDELFLGDIGIVEVVVVFRK